MGKEERITQLEEIVNRLEKRIELLEARPQTIVWPSPSSVPYSPFPNIWYGTFNEHGERISS